MLTAIILFLAMSLVNSSQVYGIDKTETTHQEEIILQKTHETIIENSKGYGQIVSPLETQLRQIAQEYGLEGDILIRLAKCESSLNTKSVGDSGHSRGLFQIHNGYWPNITDAQAFSPEWSAHWTAQKIANGQGYLWSCWRKIIK